MKKRLFFESSLITILSFIILWLFYLLINISFAPFNYVVNSISSIDLNDLYFSSLDKNNIDTNILIINIGDADRNEINDVLEMVADADPAVVGIDIFFSKYLNTPYDSALRITLTDNCDKFVLVSNYENGVRDDNYWTIEDCNYGHAGILTTNNKTGIVREFEPYVIDGDKNVYSFSSQVVDKYDNSAFERLKKRDNKRESIHYIGSGDAFFTVHYRDFLEFDQTLLSVFKDKIVFIGYCGDRSQMMTNYTDTYYTPVGSTMSSNRLPDMYGVAVHANIASMIINRNYITVIPGWIVMIVTILLSLGIIFMLTRIYLNHQLYFNVSSKLIQLLVLVLLLWISFLIFSWFQVKFSIAYLLIITVIVADVVLLYELLAIVVYKVTNVRSLFIIENDKK